MNMYEDNVLYSLNKKQRWRIPNILRSAILLGDYEDLETNVKLIISENTSVDSHTKGYYTSKGQTQEFEKERCFNGRSVIEQINRANVKTEPADQPVIQIEVVRPCPTTGSGLYNPKYIGHGIFNRRNGSYRARKTPSRKQQRNKFTVKNYCEEFYDSFEENVNEYETETEDDIESSAYLYKNSNREWSTDTIEDIMVHRALFQSLYDSKKYNRKQFTTQTVETKGKQIYSTPVTKFCEKDDNSTDNIKSKATEILSHKVMDPVYVVLPKEELQDDFLIERYGNYYRNCACFPRKFIIDISDRMKRHVRTSEHWKREYVGKWDFTSCVVFTFDPHDNNNTSSHSVYKVYLNMGTTASCFKILTIPAYSEGFIEDFLQKAVLFLDMLSTDEMIEQEKYPPTNLMIVNFEKLNRYQNVEKDITFVTRNSFYKDIFNASQTENKITTAFDLGFEYVVPEFCGICFGSLADVENTGTALTSCGHWFCDACWVAYCRSRLAMGSVNINCPELKCSEIVDDAVLLTFVNIMEVLDLKRRENEILIQSSDSSKWCPNPQCGRVIKITNVEKASNLVCRCGMQICFQCLQQAHWPISCDVAIAYWKRLKRNGDDSLLVNLSLQVKVRGKQCPQCKRFIEKRGGCFYMSCICGATFCWGCLGIFPGHINTDICNQGKNSDDNGTTSYMEATLTGYEDISQSCDYKMAVNHRNARHPMNINKLKGHARRIRFKCKNIAKRKGPVYFTMFSNTDPTDSSHKPAVEDKIKDLLSNMIALYTEFHHIAEYSHVFLEKSYKRGNKCVTLRTTVEYLGTCASDISQEFAASENMKDMRPILASLMKIQQKTDNIMKYIVRNTRLVMNVE